MDPTAPTSPGIYLASEGSNGKYRWERWAIDPREPRAGWCLGCPHGAKPAGHKGLCDAQPLARRKAAPASLRVAFPRLPAVIDKKKKKKPITVRQPSESSDVAMVLLRLNGVAGKGIEHTPAPIGAESTIIEFLETCKLGEYARSMIDAGWDDVSFLSGVAKKASELDKILASDGFPIRKPGHVAKFADRLRAM